MGPTCEVLLVADDEATIDAIDGVLSSFADRIIPTRKGRVWDIWIRSRPVHVEIIGTPPTVNLAAGCNSFDDYNVLRQLAAGIAEAVGGVASEPEK